MMKIRSLIITDDELFFENVGMMMMIIKGLHTAHIHLYDVKMLAHYFLLLL